MIKENDSEKTYDSAKIEIILLELTDAIKTSNTFGFGDDTEEDIFD